MRPASTWLISPLTCPTARSTPLPPNRVGSPSRSFTASRLPVGAPEGTPARTTGPLATCKLTANVGRARESSTSTARTDSA
jgi:hypothetical protein